MIREKHQLNTSHAADLEAFPLLAVAEGLVAGFEALMPGCAAAVVGAVGSEWQMLASGRAVDMSTYWRASAAAWVREHDTAAVGGDWLVTPFSSAELHAQLVLVAEPGRTLPADALWGVEALLSGGGSLVDRAIAAQRRDRVIRRVVAECRQRNGYRLRTIGDLEGALAALWPGATARFHHQATLAALSRPARRLVRAACEHDEPAVGRTPAGYGLLPRDLSCQFAIPIGSPRGAILVTAHVAGEEPDSESVATALSIARSPGLVQQHPLWFARSA